MVTCGTVIPSLGVLVVGDGELVVGDGIGAPVDSS